MSQRKSKTFPWPTIGGYDLYEVMSALQKTIRRGLEEDALFWGTEMYLSDYADHAWNRLLVISSEDVGLAAPDTSVRVKTLYDMYSHDKKAKEARLYFVNAILVLVRAPKSRIVDHATIALFREERPHREIPDYALDVHTGRGRDMGRGPEHFFEIGSVLAGTVPDDPYRDRAKKAKLKQP